MMNFIKIMSILCCLSFLVSCEKDDLPVQRKNDLEKDNLKSSVLSILESNYTVEVISGQVVKKNLEWSTAYKYNTSGYKTEVGKLTNTAKVWDVIFYRYDLNGFLIEQKKFDINGNLAAREIYENDLKGNPLKVSYYNKSDKVYLLCNNTFNKNGYLTESLFENLEGDFQYVHVYNYDRKGNLSEKVIYDLDGKPDQWFSFDYDDKYCVIREKEYSDGHELRFTTTYKYDKHSNLTERIYYCSHNDPRATHTFQYQYDSQNNWTECINFIENSPVRIVERVIEYY